MQYFITLFLTIFLFTGCTYTLKIQDGEMAIDRKQYAVAVDMLKKEYQKADTRVERGQIAYLLGQAYDGLNQGADAINWYKIAYDNQYGVDALRNYALALKQNEQYEEAAQAFRDLGFEIGSPYEYRREVRSAEIAAEWAAEENKGYTITPLSANSSASEYAPVLFGDNKLVVTSDRSAATGDEAYNWTGQAFSDLFVLNLSDNSVTPFAQGVNTPSNEGTPAFIDGGKTLIFTRCEAPKGEDAFCKLYESTRLSENAYGPAKALPFQQAGINYMHPTISSDGQTVYFSSDDPDNGWGGFDIYSVSYQNGIWGDPNVLSRSINTAYDEQFPTIDRDTMYFSSDGHLGMGGLDIFRTYPLGDGNWAPAFNLKTPINSGGDDFGLVVDRRQNSGNADIIATGYFSSRRGEQGGDDLYQFEQRQLPPEPEPTEEIVYRNTLDVFVVEKIYEDPGNPNSRVLGRKPLPGANISVQVGSEERNFSIDESGKISLVLQSNSLYAFTADKVDYLSNDGKFSSIGLPKDPSNPDRVYELEIVLDRIFLNREIVLENIYYDFDQSFIRDDAKPTLNELAEVLTNNPSINIELGSHTDCRGGDSYNKNLSQARAQAAVDYLINQKNIDPIRLSAQGYGEDEPANDCLCSRCTEEEHQENRRTTFKIVQ